MYTVYLRDGSNCVVTESVTISEPAEVLTPSVSGASTTYGTVTSSGLVITADPMDANVSHYQITNIVGGVLFKNDGVTEVEEDDFITSFEGADGLVFSPTVAGTGTFDIQSSGTDQATCLGGTKVTASTTVGKAALTATANATMTYGDDIPSITVTYSGFVNGEGAGVVDTEPNATTTAAQFDDAGTYVISLTGGSDDNYTITNTNGTLTVDPAPLQVTANNQTITYGDAIPTLGFTYAGFVGSDNAASLIEEPTASSTAAQFDDAGNYDIVLSGGLATNYQLSLTNGSLTVQKASLTAMAVDQMIIYGDAIPTLSHSYSGFVGTDDESDLDTAPTISTTAQQFSSAGSYTISTSGGSDINYNVTHVDGVLNVAKKDLTVTATDTTVSYGSIPASYALSYGGFVNNEDSSAFSTLPSITTAATSTSIPGAYTITPGAGVIDNYNPVYVDGTLTINAATLTLTADNKTIAYGDSIPQLTISATGLQNGEEIDDLNVQPTISTLATLGSDVGSYQIAVSGASDDRYTISYGEGTLDISKATLTATAVDATMTYGSSALPALSFGYTGFVLGEDASVIDTAPSGVSTTANSSSDAGAYPIMIAPDAADDNYDFSYVDGTLSVLKAVLAVSPNDTTRRYGSANPLFTLSYEGFVNGEDESVLDTIPGATTLADSLSSIGSYAISASGGSDNNYSFNFADGTLTISKAVLIVTAVNQAITFGDSLPVLGLSYDGFVGRIAQVILTRYP